MTNFSRPMVLLVLLAIFILVGAIGGPGNSFDVAVNALKAGLRHSHPQLTSLTAVLTQLGSVYATLGLGLLAAAWLAFRGRRRSALFLAAIVLLERLSVDGLKIATARPRPATHGKASNRLITGLRMSSAPPSRLATGPSI